MSIEPRPPPPHHDALRMKVRHRRASKRRHLCVHERRGMDSEVMRFRCTGCKRLVCGWCQGAADDHPELCDPCWVKAQRPVHGESA